ncbi:ribonuclease P/MRP protein subunit POP5 [Diabrotica virgifera virgifera]|uniref:Ribonuclease P/MRP protein subunit POP5 n=1 Tax=Diabrotica virgifera virgifera TaxID=50390 RepID=A0A6P7F972_DIAVI|nr:ribonuclease P/MRP protein subunit POP5 [Diabrotica virgifera virgifera]
MVRHKNRYIVIEINENEAGPSSYLKLKEPSLYVSILKQVRRLYGDFGEAAIRAGFVCKYLNEHTRIGIIRSRRGPHKFVTSVIPLIREMEDKRILINILYVGATIRKSFYFLRNYQQKKFNEYCVSLKSEEDINQLKEAMLNFESILTRI